MNKAVFVLSSLVFTFVLTLLILKRLVAYFRMKAFGQKILEDGPIWHKKKEGTPTMGGISFVISSFLLILLGVLILNKYVQIKETILILNVLFFCLLNALIGLIDDLAKIKNNKNQGLTARGKFILQAIATIAFLVLLGVFVGIKTTFRVPFTDLVFDLGALFYVLSFFLICGMVNSVNLTDGLDGLAGSVMLTVGLFAIAVSLLTNETLYLTVIGGFIVGAALAFLKFNLHPAKIFMGDTGSLFFGAMTVSVAFLLERPFIVLLFGILFLVEAVSVILQVTYFKISKGKRLFLMAPLHHHFEKKGWSENKIVLVFSLINLIGCAIAFVEIVL